MDFWRPKLRKLSGSDSSQIYPPDEDSCFEAAVGLTDLDRLYLALAETGQDYTFNTLYYFLNITSIKSLKEYNPTGNSYFKFLQLSDAFVSTMKYNICEKHFDFQQLAVKFKRSDVIKTCWEKEIPVIKRKDLQDLKPIAFGPEYYGVVCQAQWTRPDGIKEKVCLRYENKHLGYSLHEAEISSLLHHPNILPLHGVVISSPFSPSVALVVEFSEYGNLHESRVQRSVERLCRFTIQTASALEHLESKNIIHQAVDSNNCFVVSKDQVKLSCLGRCHSESELERKLSPSARLTQKDVVYQFAKLFSTYFARYEELNPETMIAKSINKTHGARYGPVCPPHFCEVFDRCLFESPDARPSFKEIRQSLVAMNYASKVKVINSFSAESAEFLSCKAGELITLIAKDCHRKDKTAWLGETEDLKIGFFKSKHVQEQFNYDSSDGPIPRMSDLFADICSTRSSNLQVFFTLDAGSTFVPAEIRGRGPRAERAFQKAMQSGKVKVYRGRIMLLGQDRAGKTSLEKSLLGLPFDPKQESTVGVQVDPSKCEVEVDQVKNWMPSEQRKRKISEFEEGIARFIARDLTEAEGDQKDSTALNPNVEKVKTTDQQEEKKHKEEPQLLPDVVETATDTEEKSDIVEDNAKEIYEEKPVDEDQVKNELQLNINSTTLPHDVTDLVVRYLQSLRLEDDIKAKEVILTLWDFAGQHLYYASHSVFLSGRAVYLLVYNLNKNLMATAEPCVRQGITDILLDNPNNETNLDNLLSWLVSVHNIRSDAIKTRENQGTKQSCLRPPVIIVGTHSDQPFEDVRTTERHIIKSISDKAYVKHIIKPFFAVDNRTENDQGVQKLRQRIMEVLKDEPYMGEEVPLRWFNFERAVDALVAKQTYFMDLDRLVSVIRQVCHIDDEEEITAMLNFYHDLGVIVKHGGTVVLQAQWLIDLFKQLITVRPFVEAHPLYLECWKELEENGILRTALVDHVFSEFIQKGLFKQDILDMMELYGLIAKFSIATGENEAEQKYFVPTQLRSSPLGLYQIKPSECDPCPLILYFLDGFVPHGLFPQLVSKFIHWCSENGLKQTPQLFNNGARLFVGKETAFDLILICRKRLIKVIVKRRNLSSSKPSLKNATNKMAVEVRKFIEKTLIGFSRDLCWLSNLRYELSVVCTHCLQSMCSLHRSMSCCEDDCLHLLRVSPGEELICPNNFSDEAVKVPGWEKWFEVPLSETEETKMDNSEAVGVDESSSFKPGIPSRDDVLLIAHEVGSSWKMVGRVLNVPDAVIDQIEADESKVLDKSYSVLRCWQEMYAPDATYQRLAHALQDPLVGKSHLAAKFCGLRFSSDVKEGKGDKKAIDEEGKQYGGNEAKDDGGGAEADKTEMQGQEHYEQDTYDDDLSGQISERTGEDLSHGIHELQWEEREEPDKVAIFEGRVTSEGLHLDLNVGAIHLTFPPDTVAEPTGIMVYRWKYGASLPRLMGHEAVVSDVIEISAATEVGALKFNSEVKLVLSHSAADLEGYEVVLKRLTDAEKNEWEEIAGCNNIRQVADIDDCPCPNNVPYSFPAVRASITKCSTYAVVSRLKLSPTYTITVSGGTFVHPDYPQVTITVPQKAVTTETRLSLELGVQEIPQDEFQGHGLFCGPILRVLCSSRATFLKPVTIQLPVSLGNKLVNIPQPSECRVRIFFLSSERETKEWIEISDKLENPASYDGKLVKFKVQHFSRFAFVVGAAVAAGIITYQLSKTRNQARVANFLAYFDPKKRLGSHDILFLICCPAHRSKDIKQELEKVGLTPCEVTSKRDMIPGRDKAFVFVSGGINFASSEDMGEFFLRFHGNVAHRDNLRVRLISDEVYCKVEFRKTPDTTENKNLLSTLNLTHSQPKELKEDIPEPEDGSVSFKPGTPSDADVLLIAHELGPLWKEVGLALKVPKAVIDQIEAKSSKVSDKCYTVLTGWQERYPYDATYRCLALALQHPVVGRADLAAKYCGLQFGKDVPVAKDY